jgi:hypothetical protein
MVREVYGHNRIFRPGGTVAATLKLLFDFTAKSGQIGVAGGGPANKPTLPSDWIIDWRRFLDFGTTDTNASGLRLIELPRRGADVIHHGEQQDVRHGRSGSASIGLQWI